MSSRSLCLAALFALIVSIASVQMHAQSGQSDGSGQPPHLPMPTRWAKDVSPEHVLPEYPRPQLVRPRWSNLNGAWDYAIRDSGAGTPEQYDGKILVPFPIESQLGGVERRVTEVQRVWYRRTFKAPRLAPGERLLLHFGAVDYETDVSVNGRSVGLHRGGYDPFTFDITDALRQTPEQELVVRVWDPTNHGTQPVGKQALQPSEIFYTAVSGIWQTVWLEPVPRASIRTLVITPDVTAGVVRVYTGVTGAGAQERVRVTARAGARTVGTAAGRPGDTLTIRIPRAHLWSPDDPFLYDLRIELASGDRVQSYFGMRQIALARDKAGINRLFLNGRPLFELGALDQGWWPDGLYTAPTDAALRFDIEHAKQLGFNLLRKHIKVEPARWYYHADKLGMLVWQDMPAMPNRNMCGPEGKGITPPERAEFKTELHAMVDALRNSPSVILWVLFNGGMGQHDTKQYVDWLRGYDPTRLIDAASGLDQCAIETGSGDVIDHHPYPDPKLDHLEPHRAAVISEFGGWGFAIPHHLWKEDVFSYGGKQTTQELGEAYRSLIRKVRELEAKGLAAAVYTQWTDVEGEINGIMTYDREIQKMPDDAMRENLTVYEPVGPPAPTTAPSQAAAPSP